MSYNWIKADTAEARERLKELLDKGNFVIAKKGFGPNRLAELSVSLCKNEYMVNGKTSPMPFDDLVYLIEDGEFLDPNPAHLSIPSNEAISAASKDFKEMFEAVFASSLRLVAIDSEMLQKGFEAGAKWMVEQMNCNQCPAS